MALSDYKGPNVPRRDVKISENVTARIRAIGGVEMVEMLSLYQSDVEYLWEMFVDEKTNSFSAELFARNYLEGVRTLMTVSRPLLVKIISCATEEDESGLDETVRILPVPTIIFLLRNIFEESTGGDFDVGNILALLATGMRHLESLNGPKS